jgi:hypothetical protein
VSFSAVFVQRCVAAVLILLLGSPSMAASGHGKHEKTQKPQGGSAIEGRILGQNGKPLRGAVVVVRSLDGDVSWSSLPSDSHGQFRLRALPYGWADLLVRTEKGEFLGDQAINLPPGTKVIVSFNLLETADKPASWWTDRRVEPPAGVTAEQVAGMAQSSQKLTGVEYWKSPAGIAILATVGVVVLAYIAKGGGKYSSPTSPTSTTIP